MIATNGERRRILTKRGSCLTLSGGSSTMISFWLCSSYQYDVLGPTETDLKAALAREPVSLLHRLNLIYLAGLDGLPRLDLGPLLASPSNFYRGRPLQPGTPWRPRADLTINPCSMLAGAGPSPAAQ